MKRFPMFLAALTCWFAAGSIHPAVGMNPDAETLRQRFADSFKPASVSAERVKSIIKGFDQKDSLWPSINYRDLRYIAFEHSRHWGST